MEGTLFSWLEDRVSPENTSPRNHEPHKSQKGQDSGSPCHRTMGLHPQGETTENRGFRGSGEWPGARRMLSHPQGAQAAAAMVTSASCLIHLKQQKEGGYRLPAWAATAWGCLQQPCVGFPERDSKPDILRLQNTQVSRAKNSCHRGPRLGERSMCACRGGGLAWPHSGAPAGRVVSEPTCTWTNKSP